MNTSDNGTLIEMIQQMNSNFMGRLSAIEHNVSKLTVIESEMQYLRSGMSKLQLNNTQITTRLSEVEKSCQSISNMFDDNKVKNEDLIKEMGYLKRENENFESEAAKFDEKCEMFSNEISELKARSMQQNLVFYGLAESPAGDLDMPDSKLRDFLKSELVLDDPNFAESVVFDRVHRIGRPKRYPGARPRPIVPRFERYRDREVIRSAAKELNDKHNGYNIREQFPPEMEEKRKTLYPVMRKALQDSRNRVALVRDKLFINGEQYIPPSQNCVNPRTMDGEEQSRRGVRLNDGGRRYVQGVRAKQQAQQYGAKTFNYFDRLSNEQSDRSYSPARAGKRGLSSPEQEEALLKRSRDIETVPKCSIEDTETRNEPSLQSAEASDEPAPVTGMDYQTHIESESNCENTTGKTQTVTVDVHSGFDDTSCLTGSNDNENSVNHDVTA